jgi:ATP-binding cassette, subfamily C, bacterial CydCD
LQPGTLTAVVGPTGTGKTTFAHLLLGYLQPDKGRLLINNMSMNDMDMEQWQQNVAYVPQHPHFFNGSLLDNLLMANPAASTQQVEDAAIEAGAHHFISQLPNGYHTILTDNAERLSGGEKQRLAIARALLKNAPLLILDEPTSNLDPESEQLVAEATTRIVEGRTTLVIAHRLKTVKNAHNILVFSNGIVAESGKHSELIRQDGIYAGYLSVIGERYLKKTTMIRKLTNYISAHKLQFAGALILAVGTILAGIGLMSTSGYLISRAAQRPMIVDLFIVTAGVRFFGISRAVVRYFERVVSHDLTFKILLSMRTQLYNQIEAFSQKWLMSKRPGELLSSITSDIETLQNVYLRVISPVIVAIIISIITFGGLAFYDIRLAFVILAFFIINGTAVPYLATYLAKGRGKENVDTRTKMKVFLVDRLQGLQDLIWMGRKESTMEEFNEMQDKLDQIQHKNAGTSGLIEGLNNLMAHTAMFTVLVLSIPLVVNGEIKGVMLAALTLGVLSSFEAFQGLANAFVQHEASEEAASRLFSLAQEVPNTSAGTYTDTSTGTSTVPQKTAPPPIA